MDFFGIGIPEAVFFILIMLIILGPSDMVKVGRTLGTNIRKIMTSPTWRMIFSTSNSLRNLPNALAREAGVEELRKELQREADSIKIMQKELNEAMQVKLPTPPGAPTFPKTAPLKDTPSAATPAPAPPASTDFAAWTTPAAQGTTPSAAAFPENQILPPSLRTPKASPVPTEPDPAPASPPPPELPIPTQTE